MFENQRNSDVYIFIIQRIKNTPSQIFKVQTQKVITCATLHISLHALSPGVPTQEKLCFQPFPGKLHYQYLYPSGNPYDIRLRNSCVISGSN